MYVWPYKIICLVCGPKSTAAVQAYVQRLTAILRSYTHTYKYMYVSMWFIHDVGMPKRKQFNEFIAYGSF